MRKLEIPPSGVAEIPPSGVASWPLNRSSGGVGKRRRIFSFKPCSRSPFTLHPWLYSTEFFHSFNLFVIYCFQYFHSTFHHKLFYRESAISFGIIVSNFPSASVFIVGLSVVLSDSMNPSVPKRGQKRTRQYNGFDGKRIIKNDENREPNRNQNEKPLAVPLKLGAEVILW